MRTDAFKQLWVCVCVCSLKPFPTHFKFLFKMDFARSERGLGIVSWCNCSYGITFRGFEFAPRADCLQFVLRFMSSARLNHNEGE